MNYAPSTRQRIADLKMGIRVNRATANMATTVPLFHIYVGRVLMNLILGEVTEVLETKVSNTKLVLDPVEAGTTNDLCATADFSDLHVGTLITIAGVAGTAIQTTKASETVRGQDVPVVLAVGDIEPSMSATLTGSIKWSMWYVPLDKGAYVLAV